MRPYRRLTEGDRHQVYALYKAGLRQCAVAEQIGVQKLTISWEPHHNKGLRGYHPKRAHRLACSRQVQILRTRILAGIWTEIDKMIHKGWSSAQINGKLNNMMIEASVPSGFTSIYTDKRNGGDLHIHLRCQKQGRKRYGSIERRG